MNCKKFARKHLGLTEIIYREIDWRGAGEERERAVKPLTKTDDPPFGNVAVS